MLQRRPRRPAFTLIELLVVIGIIMVLISILIPVVSKMRIQQQTASSKAQMSRIQFAINSYYNDFLAYPGAVSNKDLASNAAPLPQLTQAEDLYVALVGGWIPTSANPPITLKFDASTLGMGPMSFNPNAASAGRKNAYIENRSGESTPLLKGVAVPLAQVTELDLSYVKDTEIPEFLDQYSSPRPFLYIRANPGAKNSTANSIIYNGKQSNAYKSDFVYDFGAIAGYSNANAPQPPPADKQDWGGTKMSDTPGEPIINYFTSSISPSNQFRTARFAGTYILIGAGPDRIYGTADDMIVGGGGG